jgi:predicted alpha-1,2-mannosidase
MYRVGLFPTAMHEPDAQGHLHHYSPYDGRVHPGKAYTNNGFWDTHRTVYPLLAGLDPQGFGEIVDGLLAAYREGGWLPKWTSPGYRDCMVGTHVDAVIAEAFAHDIPGFDRHEAYAAIRQHAFTPGDPGGRWGRVGLEPYEQLGYVDDRIPHSVCRTLDFAYCDWCIAQVAARLGHDDDARTLTRRSRRYRHLWDPGVGFMRPRRADGTWAEPWDEFAWAPAYIEGGPWQHSWAVPHDLDGLAGLIGGRDALADKLERLFETPPRFGVGGYPEEIHEMTEMALARDRDGRSFGQYAHSNQPSHAVLWQLHELGRHAFADAQITRVCRDLYTPDDLPGDEDNGQMSAWYLLTTLGRRRPCPGRPLGTR